MPRFNASVTFTIQVRADYALKTALEQSAREAIEKAAGEDAQSIESAIGLASACGELNTDACEVLEVEIKVEKFEERA
jgi:bacterioferritin-associated ferredoxin